MLSDIRFWLCERLFIVKLNSQSNDTPPFRAPVATPWMAWIVYGSAQATMFVAHLQSQDYLRLEGFFVNAHTLNGGLEDHEEQFAEFEID